jgi:hypothetical protein
MTNATTTAPATTADLAADALREIKDKVTAYLAELEGDLARASSVITSEPFVVGFRAHGFYVKIAGMTGLDVLTSVQSCGIRSASRFSRADAEAITRGGNIKNGEGLIAEPIGYVQALRAEIATARATVALYADLGKGA